MHHRGALRLILLATLPLLSLWGPAAGQDPRFGASAYYVTIPSSLDIGGSVFQQALDLGGHCNVVITSVNLDGTGSEMFTAMESNGVIMVLVNTSNLQVGAYELNITVTGTILLQCPSSASDAVTTSIAATSGETTQVITPSQSGASPMATMTFSAAQTSSVEETPTFSPSPTSSPTQAMSFAASAGLVVSVVLPTVLSVDNSAPFPTETITFDCSYWDTSANSVSYVWMVDGVMVENETQSLYFLNVSFNNNGTTVHCLANGEMSNQLTVDVQQPRLSIVTDPAPTLNLTFQQLQLPALVLKSGTTVNGTCTFLGGPQFELFGAFSFVQVAEDGTLLEGEEIDRPIENGVPEVIPVFSPGVAFCRAVVDGQNITSQMILFTIIPIIQNLAASPSTGVPQGSPLNLTCVAVGGPTLNVTWTTPTEPRLGSVISIDSVTTDDAGEYTCEVTSEAGTTNDSITIRVGVRVEVQPMNQFVSVNGTLLLTCIVSGSEPISYQWLKDGQQLQDDGRVSGSNDSMLVVDPVEGDDFGRYRCNASNDVDQVLSEVAMVAVAPVIVNLTASPSTGVPQGSPVNLTCEAVGGPTLNVTWTTPTGPKVGSFISVDSVTADDAGEYRCEVTSEAGTTNDSITIRVGVRVEIQPMNQSVSVNGRLLLTCNVSGSEPISYQWLKDGQQLQDDGRISGSNGSVLVVDPVEGDDFGGYWCNASNDVDQVQSEVAMVAVAPVIVDLTASPSTGVPQGSPLNLTCEAVGGPTLNVTWTTPTGPRVGSFISIDSVTADDAGEYRCEVTSEAGTTNDSITIRVGVRVVDQPEDQFVSVNGRLSLTCNVSGSEPISYHWLKDGQQLQDDGRISGSNASVLLVDPVEGDDFGGYRCNASNDVDQVQSEVAMVAVAPNGTVVVTQATETLSVNESVTFTCMSEGGPSNVFQWSLNGVDLPGENGTMLCITGVDAADGGTYTCTVSNAAGMDQASALLRVNPILLEEPVDTNISLFDDGMLFCRARGFPTPEVLWYQNGIRLDVAALGNVNVTAMMMSRITTSTLTITNATFANSGRYFCSATSIDPNVISVNSSEVDVIVRPNLMDPVGFTVVIVDLSAESDPVTASFSWTTLDNVTFGGQDITYTVTVSYQNGSEVVSQSIPHPHSSLEIPGLLACANLTATLVAERGSESSNGTVDQFITSEPTGPTNVEIDGMMSDYPAGSDISLQCSWDTSVYYVAWYKNGTLIYEEDLAASSVLMGPPQGISVDSGYTTMMSTLTIASAALDDSGSYTCAVTCGAKGVEFGMIAGNLQDTVELFVYEPPSAPNGLEVVIKVDNTAPVTAVISWMPLMGSAMGIPPGANQILSYFVEVSNSSSAVLFSATVEHPTNMTEAPNLPACETLTVSVTAENLFFNRTTANKDFMTVEPADPVVTLTPAVDPLEGNATDNVTLTCSWNSTVFYLVWFKDGAPLYSRNLVSGDTVDSTSASVAVEVEGLSSTLTFSQVSDSGSYTCAVTCRAKDSAEEDIPVQFRATKEVLIYDIPNDVVDFAASVGFLSVTFTWTLPSFLGVPPTLDPADFIYYIVDVMNDTDSVGGATVPHPTTTVVVNLTYPCEEYTATIFARNRQAGNGPLTMETFTLNETNSANVSLSPTEDPVTYLFRAASANNTIMLSCSWDAEVYYVGWLRNGAPFYGEDRVRGLQLEEYETFSGTASVVTNFAARSSTLQVTDAFITDSANYTCAVTCRARQVVRGEMLEVSEEFSATREVLVLAVPDDLMATERRPTYLVVQWRAPPSPFSGNYRLTYGPLGGMMTTTTVSGVSLNITGLQPFTNYRVSVQASSAPVVDYGPTLSGVFPTLPEAEIPPEGEVPTIVVSQVGDGSSGIVEIIIPSPPFDRQDFLSHLWVVCIRNILPTTRSTAPDTAFPDSSTFGTYDNAEDNVPYVASEFDAAGINFPYTFGVGDESEPNDFPNQYRNGPVMAGRDLDCFVRYFVSTEAMPMTRRRRDTIPNRQYDVFQSTEYSTVRRVVRSSAVQVGLIAGGVVMAVILTVTIPLVTVMFIYTRRRGKGKYVKEDQPEAVVTHNSTSF